MRLVLDSNIWLDWLLFDDPAVTALKQAKQDDAFEIVIDTPCRAELERVLGYEKFGLDPDTQSAMLAEVDRLSIQLGGLNYAPAEALPYCADPDDVKFLALAAASGADWLITKDNALLGKRRRRTSIACRIATPQQWSLPQSAPDN